MSRRFLSFGVLVAFSLISFASGCRERSEPSEAPSGTSTMSQGVSIRPAESFDLAAYRGKILLVNVWATWCGYCRKEIPHLIELYDRYKGDDFELVGISIDRGGEMGEKAVHAFAEKAGITYPLFLDSRQQIVRRLEGVLGLPTTFLMDRNGQLYKRYSGFQREGIFEQDIEALLK